MTTNNKCIRKVALLIVGVIIMCISCTSDNLAGGNSSETTNTKILASTNEVAKGAKVYLIDAENWTYYVSYNKSPILDSTTTNNNGEFRFDSLPLTNCNLQIDHESSGLLLRNFSRGGKEILHSDTLKLLDYAAINGSCLVNSDSVNLAMLEGSGYTSSIISNKQFSLAKVAPGIYPLFFKSQVGFIDIIRADHLNPRQNKSLNNIVVNFKEYFIDDFEDGDSISIPGLITGAHWYNYVDVESSMHKTIAYDAVNQNYYLDADIILRTNQVGSFAGTGVYLDKNHGEWNLSTVKSISFQAKGSGTFRISMESAAIDDLAPDSIYSWPHFGALFTLDSTWKSFTIPVDSLKLIQNTPIYNSGITWAEAVKRIVRIEFEVSPMYSSLGACRLMIDNVKLDGISDTEFFRQIKLREK
jgi:hypothetical protein